jgi:hypothetical protein
MDSSRSRFLYALGAPLKNSSIWKKKSIIFSILEGFDKKGQLKARPIL